MLVMGQGYQWRLSAYVFVFPHDVSKTAVARITQLNTEMYHYESWNSVYFQVKKIKVMRHKNIAVVGFCTLVSARFF